MTQIFLFYNNEAIKSIEITKFCNLTTNIPKTQDIIIMLQYDSVVNLYSNLLQIDKTFYTVTNMLDIVLYVSNNYRYAKIKLTDDILLTAKDIAITDRNDD